MQNIIFLNFHKVTIKIESEISEFIEFIALYFSQLASYQFDNKINIQIKFEKIDKDEYDNLILCAKNKNKLSQLSRSIFYYDSTVQVTDIQYFPGLVLSFRIEQNTLEVSGYYYHPSSVKKYLGRILFHKNSNLKLYLYLKYYLVLFPVIFYYEHFFDKYLLHASALLYKNKPILFSGLGGIGKSTFVLSLLRNPEFQFISDNLILYGENELFAVNEAIALDENSLKLCKNAEGHLESLTLQMSHERNYYRVKNSINSAGKVQKIFFLKFSDISQITNLTKIQAKEKIDLINSIAKEILEYRTIASAINLSLRYEFTVIKDRSIDNLLEYADSYELSISKKDDLNKVHFLLQDVLG